MWSSLIGAFKYRLNPQPPEALCDSTAQPPEKTANPRIADINWPLHPATPGSLFFIQFGLDHQVAITHQRKHPSPPPRFWDPDQPGGWGGVPRVGWLRGTEVVMVHDQALGRDSEGHTHRPGGRHSSGMPSCRPLPPNPVPQLGSPLWFSLCTG